MDKRDTADLDHLRLFTVSYFGGRRWYLPWKLLIAEEFPRVVWKMQRMFRFFGGYELRMFLIVSNY